MEKNKKSPIGVLSKKFYDKFTLEDIQNNGGMHSQFILQNRINDLSQAITRYATNNSHINPEWIQEYNLKLTQIGIFKDEFKL